MKYTRIYADSAGISYFEDIEIELALTDFAPPAPPLPLSTISPAYQYAFCILPAGWYGNKYPTPHRQFSIFLSGEVEVQAGNGELRLFRAGDILLMDDASGEGHISRVICAADVLSAIIKLPD